MNQRSQGAIPGQTLVVIGGSAGIGFETGRRARSEGANVILTARNAEHLAKAATVIGAQRTATFDANENFGVGIVLRATEGPIDHVMVTAGGPSYGPLLEMSGERVKTALSDHIVLALEVTRHAVGRMRAGGTVLFIGGTGGRRIGHGLGIVSAATAALPPFTAALALEVAPVRVNLIAAGFVDTPLSASCWGISSRRDVPNFARRCRLDGSSVRLKSPHWPCTS